MNSRKRPDSDPKWLKDALEVLDRFERRHPSVVHVSFTQGGVAKLIGKSRMTISKALREDDDVGIEAFRTRYHEVERNLKTLGDKPLTETRKKRMNQEQQIRSLEKKNEELEKQLQTASLRWMAVCRLAEREGWSGFELKLAELINPRDPRIADLIQKPEE